MKAKSDNRTYASFTIRFLPRKLHAQFKAMCALRGIRMEDAMVEAMELWLDRSAKSRDTHKEERS
jgi:hypothetical protein